MVVEILPSDAGKVFFPDVIEPKEVLEETRVKNQGRKIPSDDEDSAESSLSGSGDSSPLLQGQDDSSPEGGSSAKDSVPVREPVPPNPDFEPMNKTVLNQDAAFSGWVVKRELRSDGTFPVVFAKDGTYESLDSSSGMFSEETREKILAQARVEAEDIRRQASVEGVQAGHEKGMARAREELAPVFEELKNSIKNVMDYRGEVLRLAEQEIFELTILISKKVISSELQMRPEIVLEVVRNALDRAVGWGKATIQVNPEDYAFLEEHRLLLNEEGEEVSLARFDANPSITRGGCFLESNFGEVDARLEKQIEAVESALRETLADRADLHSGEESNKAGEPGAAAEVSSEAPSEKISDPQENQPSVQPDQPEELDVPPEEPQGQ